VIFKSAASTFQNRAWSYPAKRKAHHPLLKW
jgi:hypothetical protein